MDRTNPFLPLTFQAIHLQKNPTTLRLSGLSVPFPDVCVPSLIYYDLFLGINKSIWKTLDTFLHLSNLEFGVITCQTRGCQVVMKNCFPSPRIIPIWFKMIGGKKDKHERLTIILNISQKTLALEKKNEAF